MKIPEKLLQKYNVPVPRYTSYPPANHFTEDFNTEDQERLITASNRQEPEHIAFYIHIPFCRKICYYCGCNACRLGKGDLLEPYMEALKKEIKRVSGYLDKNRHVSQIHYGGGTPNSIPSNYIKEINDLLFSLFRVKSNAEIAIECHPAYLDEDYINELSESGFNRYSLGIQDLNGEVLKNVNREAPAIPVDQLIELIKGTGKNASVNLDFIYGLPGQTVESFTETIEKAIELKPDRLVTFSYAHVPWLKKHQQILEKRGLPGADEKMAIFLAAYKALKESGYKPIGFDHFVLPDDELYLALNSNMLHRNFQGYCTRSTTGQVYAFGASSISQLNGGYIQNVKEADEYIDRINDGRLAGFKGLILSQDQKVVREAITDLMCNKRLNWSETASRAGISPERLKNTLSADHRQLNEFQSDGLVLITDEGITLTEKGSLFIRNIAAALDPAFHAKEKKYSKSV